MLVWRDDTIKKVRIHFTKDPDYASVVNSGTCGDHVAWILYDDGRSQISGEGEIWGNDEQAAIKNAENVTIEEGITYIGCNMFHDFINLKSVVIPDSVINISNSAFENCSNLTNINL